MKVYAAFQLLTKLLRRVINSIFFFPSILALILIFLTAFSINGSSVGIYHDIFYSNSKDSRLLANQPKSVRSDEWLVGTQKTIAQANNHYKTINSNVGTGEDESVLGDAPTRNWSTAFHPENLAFFILPFNHAFAFKWWISPFLLLVSTYAFVLVFMPRRRLIASLLAVGFTFSPFMQWWGEYTPAAWLLLSFVVFTKLFYAHKFIYTALWGALLAYIAICFALILYPPFQIPAALAIIALALGYAVDHFGDITTRKDLLLKAVALVGAGVITLGVLLVFMNVHQGVINIIQNTTYPGHRVVMSGGFGKAYLFTGSLDGLLQNSTRASHFPYAANQSEASNFILLSPFIILPLISVLYVRFRQEKQVPYIFLFPLFVGLLFIAWLFVPGLSFIGKLTLLDIVPQQRLIYGVGVLDLILVVLFLKFYHESTRVVVRKSAAIYSLLVMIFLLYINFHVSARSPEFVGYVWAFILSIPVAVTIYYMLCRRYVFAVIVFALFSFFSVFKVQPLYVGLSAIRDTNISQEMINVANKYNPQQRWVTDYIYLENFPVMNGLPSLSGTYTYPQLNIWDRLQQQDKKYTYNRYAHVTFKFDHNPAKFIKPTLTNPGPDQLNISIEPCDQFFRTMDVGYLITTRPFEPGEATCARLASVTNYPSVTFYIYHLH